MAETAKNLSAREWHVQATDPRPRRFDRHQGTLYLGVEIGKRTHDARNLGGPIERFQVDAHDAVRRQSEPHGQITKIIVLGEKDAPLGEGEFQHVLVRGGRANIGGACDVEASGAQGAIERT